MMFRLFILKHDRAHAGVCKDEDALERCIIIESLMNDGLEAEGGSLVKSSIRLTCE